jgi:transcriptional repressor NrdR
VSDEQIRGMIDAVVTKLDEAEVSVDRIAELVMGELLAVDQVAYVRFASVYGQFTNVDQFLTVITEMLKK